MSAIPPHIAITWQPKTMYAPLKRSTPPATEDPPMPDPTPLSHAADAVGEAAHNAWVAADAPRPVAAASLRALVSALGTRTRGGAIILNGDAVLDLATELEAPNT